jgi:cytoskeletal protein CcmA (bactofilin family)
MKILNKLLLLFLIVFCEVGNAMIINGYAQIENATYQDLVVNGALSANNITFVKELVVNGSAQINKSVINQTVIINGNSDINDCEIIGNGEFNGNVVFDDVKTHAQLNLKGNIKISRSKFLKSIDITSAKAIFNDDTIIESDIINYSSKGFTSPVITIQDSIVKGNIIFKNKTGVVILVGHRQILGNVINGEIKN